MMLKFGKTINGYLNLKQDFFENNENHLLRQHELADLYIKQPKRIKCKNCREAIQEHDFIKDSVRYGFCSNCGHLNGLYMDTDDYCRAVYIDNDGSKYAEGYRSEDKENYWRRVKNIYTPKARFLLDALEKENAAVETLRFADLGAGSGYFVAALIQEGINHVTGFEISPVQVEHARHYLGNDRMIRQEIEETAELAGMLETDVVSLIGVLEHLQHPNELIRALCDNMHVNYIYLSVPLFSLTVFLEICFPEVFNRLLHGGHTHLYTEESLKYLYDKYRLDPLAEWWFGTDIVDLYRSLHVTLSQMKASPEMIKRWDAYFLPVIDQLQLKLDEKKLSSSVHVVLKKSKGQ